MLFLGALIGGAFGLAGTGISSALQVREARKNRAFQERMSSTAYQRGMKDMRAAGLNPLLAYSKGGASTPGGAQAQIGDFGKAANTAVQAMQAKATVANTEANTIKTVAETKTINANLPKKEAYAVPWTSALGAAQRLKKEVTTWAEGDRKPISPGARSYYKKHPAKDTPKKGKGRYGFPRDMRGRTRH